ncbi:hypothetical protein D3C84_226630 [compost metagenome]
MHVFQVDAPVELAGFDFALDLAQAVDDAVAFGVGQHADLGQHGRVGDGAHDVVAVQALVEFDGGGEAGDEGVDRLAEAAAPGLIGFFSAHGLRSANALKQAGRGWRPAWRKKSADNNRLAGKIAGSLCRSMCAPLASAVLGGSQFAEVGRIFTFYFARLQPARLPPGRATGKLRRCILNG